MKIKYSIIIVLALICCSCAVINLYKKRSNELSDNGSKKLNVTPAPVTQPKNEDMPNLYKFPEEGIPVLMYHSISTVPNNSLCLPEKQFSEEIEWLSSQNHHCLTIEEFYSALVNNAALPKKPILLTFDDGYSDNYKAALPILKKFNFKGTFFLIINSIGTERMSWDQIKELVHEGNSIGSHSLKHPDLSILSAKQQEDEIITSKQKLEDNLGISINSFCFPSGRYNQTTLELLKKSGYLLGFSTRTGKVHLGDNQFILKRIRIPAGMTLTTFQNLFK